jgi:hypothetical protein
MFSQDYRRDLRFHLCFTGPRARKDQMKPTPLIPTQVQILLPDLG